MCFNHNLINQKMFSYLFYMIRLTNVWSYIFFWTFLLLNAGVHHCPLVQTAQAPHDEPGVKPVVGARWGASASARAAVPLALSGHPLARATASRRTSTCRTTRATTAAVNCYPARWSLQRQPSVGRNVKTVAGIYFSPIHTTFLHMHSAQGFKALQWKQVLALNLNAVWT
jgi:hypothetical protein